MQYKLHYIDINYQNRQIITLTRIFPDGTAEVIRAARSQSRSYFPETRVLAAARYNAGEERELEYNPKQAQYDEAMLITKTPFAQMEDHAPLFNVIMGLVSYTFRPLKTWFLGVEVEYDGGLNGSCKNSSLIDLDESQREKVESIFAQVNLARDDAPSSPRNYGIFEQPPKTQDGVAVVPKDASAPTLDLM